MSGIRFRETQYPAPWVWAVLAVGMVLPPAVGAFGGHLLPGMLIPSAALVLIAVLFFPMTLTVDDTVLKVRMGLVGLLSWTFPLEEVKRCETVTYTPLRTYLGWGVRKGFDGSRALTARGDKGVRLELASGRIQLIGSQQSEELAAAIAGSGS